MTTNQAEEIQFQQFPRDPAARGQRMLHRVLALFLLVIVALSSIPVGSNRPIFWAISALLIALAGLGYAVGLRCIGVNVVRFPLKLIGVPAILFALFAGFLFVQILPLGLLFGPFDIGIGGPALFSNQSLSIASGETILMLMRQLGYGLFFFLMLQVAANTARARQMLLAILVIVIAQAIFAMVALTQWHDFALFGEKVSSLGVATGTFINRNSLATFLGMGAVVGLALMVVDFTKRKTSIERGVGRVIYLIGFALICAALFATQSRMGAFATLAGLLVTCLLLALHSGSKHARSLRLVFALSLVMLVAVAVLFGDGLLERIGSSDNALAVRQALYVQVIEMIKVRPWTGFGGGSFKLVFPLFHQPPVSVDLSWDKTHSSYLALWVELGFIAGSLPLIILALFARRLIVLLQSRPERLMLTVAALGVMVLVALHSLLDFSLEIQANAYLFLAILALGVAGLSGRSDRSRRERLFVSEPPDLIYAIGDVHGRYDLLLELEAKIIADAAGMTGTKLIIMLGDYIDRGPQSCQVIEHLMASPPAGFQRVCLAGNHEQMMLDSIGNPEASEFWLVNGGEEMLASYNLSTQEFPGTEIVRQIPLAHRQFLESLTGMLAGPDFVFVHAGLRPNVSLHAQTDHDLLWIRHEFLDAELGTISASGAFDLSPDMRVVHGHTKVKEPVVTVSRIGLDTGAYESGKLTSIKIEKSGAICFLSTE